MADCAMTYRRVEHHPRLVDKGMRIVDEETSYARFFSLDDACSSLAASLSAGCLSIIVGAGLSKPCGIPDWPTLVDKLFLTYLSENFTPPTPELLRYLGPNPVVQIRILQRLYKLKAAFLTDLRDALYANLTDPPTTLALQKLAHLLVLTYKRKRPLKVITYNFDDLLERAITAIDPTIPIRPVSLAIQVSARDDGLRVFHPHGYLPRGHHARCSIVFSEDEFHALMSDNAHWANVLQLEAFRNSTCLFVGTSLSDPNVRRLLDCCRQETPQPHWLTRAIPCSTTEPDLICHLVSEEMASLGVRVLGLGSYDDLSLLFEKLASIKLA